MTQHTAPGSPELPRRPDGHSRRPTPQARRSQPDRIVRHIPGQRSRHAAQLCEPRALPSAFPSCRPPSAKKTLSVVDCAADRLDWVVSCAACQDTRGCMVCPLLAMGLSVLRMSKAHRRGSWRQYIYNAGAVWRSSGGLSVTWPWASVLFILILVICLHARVYLEVYAANVLRLKAEYLEVIKLDRMTEIKRLHREIYDMYLDDLAQAQSIT